MDATRGAAPAWLERYTEFIVEVSRSSLRAADVISLATAQDRAAAKVRSRKAAIRADGLKEVLVGCAVPHRAVTAVFCVDFTSPCGKRLPRFRKDYLGMVKPAVAGSPAWDKMRHQLHEEFEADGARWLDGDLELPACAWGEFAVSARKRLRP